MKNSNKNILVFENDPLTRKIISFSLSKKNCVIEAENADHAYEILNSQIIDLVFCDSELDDIDGLDFCIKVREDEKYKALPFIFLTLDDSEEYRDKIFKAGADDYIVKPLNADDVLVKTETIFKRIEIYKIHGTSEPAEEKQVTGEVEYRVLIVDDEPMIANMIKQAFKIAKFQTQTADNAKDGFNLVRSFKPDIIISDYMMPEINGFEFRKLLLEDDKLKDIPFVFLTSVEEDSTILESYNLDIKDFIPKTTPPKVLVARVKNIVKTTFKERQSSIKEIQQAADSKGLGVIAEEFPTFDRFNVEHWHIPFEGTPGGDFIDYIQMDDNKLAIILGDIMGKKWGAWFFAFSFIGYLRSAMRVVISSSKDNSAKEILKKVNENIYKDAKISEIFSTVSLVIIDNKEMTADYSGAGDLPLVYFDSKENSVKKIQSNGILLGLSHDGHYDSISLSLSPSDTLAIITDGITEAKNKHGDELGYERFIDFLSDSSKEENFSKCLQQKIIDFTGNNWDDDVSMITIQST